MSRFDKYIDPKSKKQLRYFPESGFLKAEDGTATYPVIGGIPRFVSPDFYLKDASAVGDEVQTGRSFGDKWCDPRHEVLGTTEADRRGRY